MYQIFSLKKIIYENIRLSEPDFSTHNRVYNLKKTALSEVLCPFRTH